MYYFSKKNLWLPRWLQYAFTFSWIVLNTRLLSRTCTFLSISCSWFRTSDVRCSDGGACFFFFSLNSAPLGCAKHISILTVIKCRCPDALRDFPGVVCFSWEYFGFSIIILLGYPFENFPCLEHISENHRVSRTRWRMNVHIFSLNIWTYLTLFSPGSPPRG